MTVFVYLIFFGSEALVLKDYLVITSRAHDERWLWNDGLRERQQRELARFNETGSAGPSLWAFNPDESVPPADIVTMRLLRNVLSIVLATVLLFITLVSEGTRAAVARSSGTLEGDRTQETLLRDDTISLRVRAERSVALPSVGRKSAARRMRQWDRIERRAAGSGVTSACCAGPADGPALAHNSSSSVEGMDGGQGTPAKVPLRRASRSVLGVPSNRVVPMHGTGTGTDQGQGQGSHSSHVRPDDLGVPPS